MMRTETIPRPRGLPGLGHLHLISLRKTVQSLVNLASTQGPLFEVDLLGTQMVFATGADIVEELCDESRFQKYLDERVENLRALGGDGLATAWTHEPAWRKAHNVLMPGLSQRAMRGYFPKMLDTLDRMFAKWEGFGPGHYFNLSDEIMRLTFDTIGVCGFGYSFGSFEKEELAPFIHALTSCLKIAVARSFTPKFVQPLQFRQNRRFDESVKVIFELVDEIVDDRIAFPERYRQNTDLLSLMLNATDKESGSKLEVANVRHQIMTFLSAGSETTNSLLAFAFYYLLSQPTYMDKARAEVDEVMGTDPSVRPTYAQLQELHFIRQVLQESLRLWPPVPIFQLYATQDTNLGGGTYSIPKGQSVNVLVPGLHRDPEVWGRDADEFNPLRFERELAEQRHPFGFKPFGNGVRACIGRQFAMMEAMSAIAAVLQRYRVRLSDRYRFEVLETLTLHPRALEVAIEPRPVAERRGPAKTVGAIPTRSRHASEAPRHGTPMYVLYGSNMGSSEDLANLLATEGARQGFEATVGPLNDFVDALPARGHVQIVCSTYNGFPPDNATEFCTWLRRESPDLSGLTYSVFGCGNTQWKTFQDVPRWLDERLETLGARRVYERGEADASVDFEGAFHRWYQPYWATLRDELALEGEGELSPEPVEPSLTVVVHEGNVDVPLPPSLEDGQVLEVLRNVELQSSRSPRSTRHIELALDETAEYRVGDHLRVQPRNAPELCARVCRRFCVDPRRQILLRATPGYRTHLPLGVPTTVERLLTERVELQSPATRKQLEAVAAMTACVPEARRVRGWLESDAYAREIVAEHRSLLDIVEALESCTMDFAGFVSLLPALAPRYYSISSSPRTHANQCSITVGVVAGPARSGESHFEGVCSSYLRRATPGTKICASLRANAAPFTVPSDPEVPIVMVAAGTGIAPFRGFLQERRFARAAGRSLGDALLLFGCRHPEEDFIYGEELREHEASGVVDVRVAFSRHEPGRKHYVQHLVEEHWTRIHGILAKGGILYVCGDAGGMAAAVSETCERLYLQNHGTTEHGARSWVARLRAEQRYREDIWSDEN
ncbi:MAG: cytochrome P450 [Myxococcota bacterium]